MNWNNITEEHQLEDIIEQSHKKPCLIFKHSTRCIISKMALKTFENEFDLQPYVEAYFLDLLVYRSLSNAIAEKFEVQHQSPQLILIKEGKAVFDASHENISVESIKKYITSTAL